MARKYDRTISLNYELALEVGVNVALVYNELVFWGDKGARSDGWVYKSYREMTSRLPLSERTIRDAYGVLVKNGLIETKVMKVANITVLHFRLTTSESVNLAGPIGPASSAGHSIYTESNHKRNASKSQKSESPTIELGGREERSDEDGVPAALTTGQLYYQVIKAYGLPVLNHTVIKAKIKALDTEIGPEEAGRYLKLLLTRDLRKLEGDYRPTLSAALDVYGKRVKILEFYRANGGGKKYWSPEDEAPVRAHGAR